MISPLAPKGGFPDLPVIPGVRFSAVEAGVRYRGRKDVMLATLAPGSVIAGVFTRSATRAAPVLDCQAKIGMDSDSGAAILVNSGNANAFTGKHGMDSVARITAAVAAATGVPAMRVFTSSTGVIGEVLPDQKITDAIAALVRAQDERAIGGAAAAIMTTDTFPKGASAETPSGIKIAGIAKGSGMIAPDMATMLVYIFTDARINRAVLQDMVSDLTRKTFNCITVDSDTSTSDSLLVCATGKSETPEIESDSDAGGAAFKAALHEVMLNLAHQVVRDGEGATKFLEIQVTGADSDDDAHRCAMAIANSPLVKTAVAGEDPNWGRVVMAVGKSGAKADRDRLSIRFGDIQVAENGWVADSYREEDGAAYMKAEDLVISVDLGIGEGKATAWTCDFTKRYIEINADYRS